MPRVAIIIVILAVSLNYSFAQTEITIGNLSYSLEKNTNPTELPPAAIAYSKTTGGHIINVRFPGCKYLVAVNGSGFYPGWSGQRNSTTGVITATSPRGYLYTFDNGSAQNNNAGMMLKLTEIKNPSGASEGIYTYDGNGRVDRIKENNSSTSVYMQFGYNANGRLETLTTTDPSVSSGANHSRTYSLVYDANNRVVSTTSSGGGGCGCSGTGEDWLVDVYDSNDRLTAQKDNTTQVIYTYSYYSDGTLHEKKDKNGNLIKKVEFENLSGGSRVMKIYDYVDLYNYRYSEKLFDAGGSVVSDTVFKELRDTRVNPNLYDSNSFTTRYLYGSNYETIIPDGADPNGNGIRTIRYYDDEHNLSDEYQYDANNYSRLVAENRYTEGRLTYTYDIRGNQTGYVYISGTGLLYKQQISSDGYNFDYYYRYLYDSQNRKVTEELRQDDPYLDDGNDRLIQTKHFEYDNYGNVCKEYRNGKSNRNDPNSFVTEYVYNTFGNLVWQINPDGVVIGKTYDGTGRVENEFILAGGLTAFNQLSNSLDFNPYSLQVISHTKYQYSSVYGKPEIVSAAIDSNSFYLGSPTAWTAALYGYDSYGRKTSERKDYLGINLTTGYQYNAQNEAAIVTYPDSHTEQTFRDGRGLTTSTVQSGGSDSLTTSYAYDNRSNLIETKIGSVLVNSLRYDDYGRKTFDYEGALTSGRFRQYLYDGDTDDVETEKVWDKDSGNNPILIKQTFKVYDVFGRIIFEQQFAAPSQANGLNDKITFYRYDILGRRTMTAYKGEGNSFYSMFGNYFYYPDYYGNCDGDIVELRKYNGNSQLSAAIRFEYPQIPDTYYDQGQQQYVYGFLDVSLAATDDYILAHDPNVSYVKYEYRNSQLLKQSIYTGIDSSSNMLKFAKRTSHEYDYAGRATKTYDADENFTTVRYDSLSQQIENTLWQGREVFRLRDANQVNPNFVPYSIKRTLTAYNAVGQNTKVAMLADPNANKGMADVNTAVDKVVDYVYDPNGHLYREKEIFGKDESGSARKALKEYGYDGLGRISLIEMGEFQEINVFGTIYESKIPLKFIGYHYNGMGQKDIETVTDINTVDQASVEFKTYYTFDNQDRVIQANNEDGILAQYFYDTLGQKIKEINFASRTTLLNYNGMGYLTSMVEDTTGIARTTSFGNDRNGRRMSVGSGGNSTLYSYNYLGKVKTIEYPDSKVIEYGYDMKGSVTSRTITKNSQGVTTHYKRDALGRIAYKQYSNNPNWNEPNSAWPFDEILYDAAGNKFLIASIDNGSDSELEAFGYDGLGNLTSGGQSYAGFNYEVSYGYDTRGLLTSVRYPDERYVVYDRDAMGRVVDVNYNGRTIAQYFYLGDKVVKKILNGIEYAATIDALGRVGAEHCGSLTFDYGYLTHTPRLTSRNSDNYGYDTLGRVTSETGASYTCDTLGNPTNATEDNLTYTLDNEDRVTAVSDTGGTIANYSYDRLGRRVSKTIGNVKTCFAYDNFGNVIAEYNQDGNTVTWQRDYVYGANGALIFMQVPIPITASEDLEALLSFCQAWLCSPNCTTPELAWDYNSDSQINFIDWAAHVADFEHAFDDNGRYVLTDFKGSVVGLADKNGNLTASIAYNAWGVPSYTGDLAGLNILWNGYYSDDETGNYYLRNRYYSPTERKFITQDPRGINPDENWNNPFDILSQFGDGFNLYEYVKSNPLMFTDYNGCSPNAMDPSQLEKLIVSKCKKCDCEHEDKCKANAKTLATAIAAFIKRHYDSNFVPASDNDHRRGGYLCWDWACGFNGIAKPFRYHIFGSLKSARYSPNKKPTDIVHYYLELIVGHNLTDPPNDCRVAIDDGWITRNQNDWIHEYIDIHAFYDSGWVPKPPYPLDPPPIHLN